MLAHRKRARKRVARKRLRECRSESKADARVENHESVYLKGWEREGVACKSVKA